MTSVELLGGDKWSNSVTNQMAGLKKQLGKNKSVTTQCLILVECLLKNGTTLGNK